MYTVYADGAAIHNPALDDRTRLVYNATLTQQANMADAFEFTIYPSNPEAANIHKLSTTVEVYQDSDLLFRGRPIQSKEGWNKQQTITCEGGLAFLNDTILRPYSYTGTVSGYLEQLISSHNAQVPAGKQFTVRTVTVTDPNNTIVRSNTDYTTTMQEIQEKLVNNLGGYLVLEYSSGQWYLDYLATSNGTTSQKITLAKNLIDFLREQNAENIATALIPLGAVDETTGQRITIKSVNNGLDYIVDNAAAATYGLIYTTEIWDDVTVPANLLTKAQARLNDYAALIPTIQLTAVDLSITNQSIEPIRLLDTVTVEDDQHAASGQFLVMQRVYNLSDPAADKVTFGGAVPTMSKAQQKTAAALEEIPARSLLTASERARAILDSATDGAIQILYNADGVAYELRINNSQDPSTATKWWRYNSGGWGYTDDGGQTYTVAATMDGKLFASIIQAGILQSSDSNMFCLDLDNGTLKIGRWNVDTNSIYCGTKDTGTATSDATLRGSGEFQRQIGGITRSHLKFAIGANFGVSTGGRLYATDGIFGGEITAASGEIGGWTISEDELGKTATVTPHTYTAQDLAVITNVLSDTPTITEEEALEQYPWCDVDGDGHITQVDLALVEAMFLGHIPNGTITSYTTAMNASAPYGLMSAFSNKGPGFSFGCYGAYAPMYLGRNIVLFSASNNRTILNSSGLKWPEIGGEIPSNKIFTSTGAINTENGTELTLATGTWKAAASMSLTAGKTYLINGVVSFASNNSGYRRIVISDTADSSTPINQYSNVVVAAANGLATRPNVFMMYKPGSNTTIYLNVYQNSGSSLSTTGYIQAMTIEG